MNEGRCNCRAGDFWDQLPPIAQSPRNGPVGHLGTVDVLSRLTGGHQRAIFDVFQISRAE
jgi:hypothetical protein